MIDPLRQLQKEGFQLTEMKPSSDGILLPEKLEEAFQDDTILVSIMMANNEIGVIQPLKEFSNLCKKRGFILHSDASQAFGQFDFNIDQLDIDFLSFDSSDSFLFFFLSSSSSFWILDIFISVRDSRAAR